jgi:hypothetical protein
MEQLGCYPFTVWQGYAKGLGAHLRALRLRA